MSKQEHYSLEGWFHGGVRRFIVNEWFSACSSVIHGVLQVFIQVNIFTDDVDEMMVCTLVRFADATQLWKSQSTCWRAELPSREISRGWSVVGKSQ